MLYQRHDESSMENYSLLSDVEQMEKKGRKNTRNSNQEAWNLGKCQGKLKISEKKQIQNKNVCF